MSCSTIYCDIINVGSISESSLSPFADVEVNVSAVSQVFSEVKATLATDVIKILPVDIEEIFHKCSIAVKLQIELEDDNLQHVLCGNLVDIISAYDKLKTYLSENLKIFEISETDLSKTNSLILENIDTSNSEETKIDQESRNHKRNTTKETDGTIKSFDGRVHKFSERSKRVWHCSKKRKSLCKAITFHDSNEIRLPSKGSVAKHITNNPVDNTDDETGYNNLTTNENASEKRIKNYEDVSPYKYFCELCSFKTKRSSHFSRHSALHKKVSSLYKCNKCAFTTIRLGHLRRHQTFHSNLVHKCKQCRYQTDDVKFLTRHIKQKHYNYEEEKQTPEIWECSHCPYKTSRQYYFDRHQRIHNVKNASSSLHRCDICCYSTKRKEHYIRHMNNVHSNQRPYLCHLCGKAFKRSDALHQHHATHTESEKQTNGNFKCMICEKKFRSHSHLYEHQAVHSTVRSFLCEICGASFKTRSVQRKHVQSIHKNPRSYLCEICDKRFNTQYAMKRHQKIHNYKVMKNGTNICMEKTDKSLPVTSLAQATTQIGPESEYLASEFGSTDTITQSILQRPETATALLYLTNNTLQY